MEFVHINYMLHQLNKKEIKSNNVTNLHVFHLPRSIEDSIGTPIFVIYRLVFMNLRVSFSNNFY